MFPMLPALGRKEDSRTAWYPRHRHSMEQCDLA